VHYLFVVISFTETTGFNELAEIIRLGQFVNEAYAFCCVFVSTEFVKVKEVSCVSVVWDLTFFV
jgi:hypothetical protein